MTRLEKAIEIEFPDYEDMINCIQIQRMTPEESIMEMCPGHVISGPRLDNESQVIKSEKTTGCRGITCEECWNKECD